MVITIEMLQEAFAEISRLQEIRSLRYNTNKLNDLILEDDRLYQLKKIQGVDIHNNPHFKGGVFMLKGIDAAAVKDIQAVCPDIQLDELVKGTGSTGMLYILSYQDAEKLCTAMKVVPSSNHEFLSDNGRTPIIDRVDTVSLDSGIGLELPVSKETPNQNEQKKVIYWI